MVGRGKGGADKEWGREEGCNNDEIRLTKE